MKGPPGKNGPRGPLGLKGSKGDRGEIGNTGFRGFSGTKGKNGPPGKEGLRGPLGPKGSKGDRGDNGSPGLPGMSGEKGQRGETGYDGAKGQKGTKGSRETEIDVHFTATLTTDFLEVDRNEIVVFDTIQSNAGEAYNSTTGKFTAPISGTFLFLFNVYTGHENKLAHVLLVLDGEGNSSTVAEGWPNGDVASSGNAAVFHVNKGESVWIETAHFKGYMYDIYGWRTSFSGVLLHAS